MLIACNVQRSRRRQIVSFSLSLSVSVCGVFGFRVLGKRERVLELSRFPSLAVSLFFFSLSLSLSLSFSVYSFMLFYFPKFPLILYLFFSPGRLTPIGANAEECFSLGFIVLDLFSILVLELLCGAQKTNQNPKQTNKKPPFPGTVARYLPSPPQSENRTPRTNCSAHPNPSRLVNYSRRGDVSAKLSIFLRYGVASRLLLLVFASNRRSCVFIAFTDRFQPYPHWGLA